MSYLAARAIVVITSFSAIFSGDRDLVRLGNETVYLSVPTGARIELIDAEIGRPENGYLLPDGNVEVWFRPLPLAVGDQLVIRGTCRLTDNSGVYEYKKVLPIAIERMNDRFRPVLAVRPDFKNRINLQDLRYLVFLSDEPHTVAVVRPPDLRGSPSEIEVGVLPPCSGVLHWSIKSSRTAYRDSTEVFEDTRMTVRIKRIPTGSGSHLRLDLSITGCRDVFGQSREISPASYDLILP